MIYCPKCRNAVVKKSQDGRVRVRTRIVAFANGCAEGVCTKCGTTLSLPLELSEPLRKALQKRLVVRKKIDVQPPSP